VIEDLHVKGMVRNHKLARAVSDMGFGRFRQMLTYKSEAYGAEVIVASRWFPSSKLCRICGVLHQALTLKDRVFVCGGCGHTEDRDVHAARNLEQYPGLQGNVTPVDCRALASASGTGETQQDEAGTRACLQTLALQP